MGINENSDKILILLTDKFNTLREAIALWKNN